jgi:YbgC/YbaW family acyl-CoA thioester hydrolase
MPRVKIDLPHKFFPLSIQIPVRITDINYGDHTGNDALVSIIHEARMQFLRHHGFTELDIEGIGLIMSDITVVFKNESFYKDVIIVRIGAGEISKVSFELIYELSCTRNEKTIVIAQAKTTMVCFDYEIKKVTAMPGKLLQILTT